MTSREDGRLRLNTWVSSALLAAMLLAVALINGRPAFFADTPFYYSQGQALAAAVGIPQAPMTTSQRLDPLSVQPGSAGASTGALTVAAARSPIYGFFFYVCERLGGLWFLTAVQDFAAAWTVTVAIRCVAGARAGLANGLALAVLPFASSLPFFAAFAMPDVFAGLDILAAALLVFHRPRLRGAEATSLFWLLVFGAASHPASLLTAAAMIPFAAMLRRLGRKRPPVEGQGGGVIAAACGTALALTIGTGAVYTLQTGQRQGSPPFLMARVLEDGPGRAYLAAHCPGGAAPDLCRFRRQPLNDAETVLWSGKPGAGVFMASSPDVRRRLQAEEPAFVVNAVLEQPLIEARAALRNWGEQLILFATVEPLHNPSEFLRYPWWRRTSAWTTLPGHAACETNPGACRPRIPRRAVDLTQGLAIGLAIALMAVSIVSTDLRRAIKARGSAAQDELTLTARFVGFLLVAVILNAGVCGVISGPFPRYEARLIWLVPLIGLLLVVVLPWRAAASRALSRSLMQSAAAPDDPDRRQPTPSRARGAATFD